MTRIFPGSALARSLAPIRPARAGNVYQPVTPWPTPTMAARPTPPRGGGK